jgi:hypothetical protein
MQFQILNCPLQLLKKWFIFNLSQVSEFPIYYHGYNGSKLFCICWLTYWLIIAQHPVSTISAILRKVLLNIQWALFQLFWGWYSSTSSEHYFSYLEDGIAQHPVSTISAILRTRTSSTTIDNLYNFPLISLNDIVSINWLTLILKIISQSDVKHIMKLQKNNISFEGLCIHFHLYHSSRTS